MKNNWIRNKDEYVFLIVGFLSLVLFAIGVSLGK
jgi:drug/metabolite transporter superfamily protein YnfA